MNTMEKRDIRRKIKNLRTMLTDAERQAAADAVFGQLEQTAAFMLADRILMYHSLPDEVSTHAFLRKWGGRKSFFLPRVNGLDLEILPYSRTRLQLGAFHIEEPEGDDLQNPDTMEMIIVPAVAYDRNGNRVGRGKGYYDRLLSRSKALKIGVAYDFQLMDEVDTEEHDIPVDIVITESGTYIRRRK